MKKLITIAAAIAAATSLMAATQQVGGYTWSYRLNGNEAEIFCDDKYDGCTAVSPLPEAGTTLAIPATLGNKPVTIIGDGALLSCTGMKAATIPNSVKVISESAFAGCTGLESVEIPNGVVTIAGRAFYNCTKLKSVSIPDTVKTIGDWAFYKCKLESVSLPNSVQSLGVRAFSDCYNITTVAFGSGLQEIGGWVFYNCGYLSKVIFTGNAPLVETDAQLFNDDSGDSSVIYVAKSSSGWGVSIPGTWYKRPIRYATDAYTVAFSANGGTGGKTFSSAGMGRMLGYYMNQLSPKRDGYVFDGWWTEKAGGMKVLASDFVSGNITCYAHWKISASTIAFNANGGTGGKTFSIAKGEKLTAYMKKLAPKRAGYSFTGWWTARTGGTWVSPSTVVSGNITYYAQWIAISFVGGGDTPWTQQYDGVWKSGTITDNKESSLSGTVSGPGVITFKYKVSSEYDCDMLYLILDGSYEFHASGTDMTTWATAAKAVEGAGTHSITWSYEKDVSISQGSDCAWVKDIAWIPAGGVCSISFNANGGTGGKTFSSVGTGRTFGYYMNQLSPKRDGYVFNGWWTAKSGGTKVTADDVAIGDATCYAHWKLPTYSVFFHANGGTGGKTFTVTKGSTLGAYMDQVSPKRDGYTFNGWWTAKTGGTKVPASTVVNAGVTYYAHWK